MSIRGRKLRRALVVAVVGLSMLTLACSAASTASVVGSDARASFVIGAHTLGGLPIDAGTSYRRVRVFFASRASSTFDGDGCRLRFPELGVFVRFFRLGDGAGTPAMCTFFSAAVVQAPQWYTANGLRVGATLRSLRHAFPRAYRAGVFSGSHFGIPAGATEWQLTTASGHAAQPILVAYSREGRVVALGIVTVGH